VPEERLTKNQRRDQARELARKERERAQRRERLLKVLIPIIVVVVLVAAGGGVAAVIINQPKPAPASANGPANMLSDGIVFSGQDGKIVATKTAALKKGQDPTPATTPAAGSGQPVHVTTYVDLSCPVCDTFEETNYSQIQTMLKAGTITLEVKPVAILDNGSSYQGNDYSVRVNAAIACVAEFDPDSFLPVMKQLYDDQPSESTSSGLTNSQIVAEIKKAGLDDSKVNACVMGQTYATWVKAATTRAENDKTLVQSGSTGFGTPTLVLNDTLLQGDAYKASLTDPTAFAAAIQAAA
jgi:protein-disulfide isomerase